MSAGIIACLAHVFSGLNIFVANQHQPVLCCAGAAPSLISLYFSYGLLLPIPLAAIHTGWIVAVQKEFPETRGAATGLLMTGGGAGLFLLPPLLQWAIEEYGWGVANCHLSFIGTSRFPCCVLSYFSLVFVMEHN